LGTTHSQLRFRINMTKTWMVFVAFAALSVLSDCGLIAAPCRVGSGVIKAAPVVGHVAATPTDACADVIDPDSVSHS
jgi:hypothetical protein